MLITVEAATRDAEVRIVPFGITLSNLVYVLQIMKSYESFMATLHAILAHPSLQRESIDAMMDASAEAIADAREVNDVVRIAGHVVIGVTDMANEDELEKELNGLIEEAETEKACADKSRDVDETRQRLEKVGREVPTIHSGMGLEGQDKVAVAA